MTLELHSALTRIIRELIDGDRDVVEDADLLEGRNLSEDDSLDVVHAAPDMPGSFLLSYELYTTYFAPTGIDGFTEGDIQTKEPSDVDSRIRPLVRELQSGERNPISDADAVESPDGLQSIEAIHEAEEDDANVLLHYNFDSSFICPGNNSTVEFNIFDMEMDALTRVALG